MSENNVFNPYDTNETQKNAHIQNSIQLHNIYQQYNKNEVLKNISFQINPNQITSILAPNGEGKTTLFATISGILLPDKGEIVFPAHMTKEHIFLVLAGDRNLYSKNTLKENIHYFASLRNISKETFEKNLQTYKPHLTFYDEKENALVESLSFGQKKMTILLGALVSDAKFLLLDEISEGLDMENKAYVENLLLQTKKDHTYLLSSHDYEFVSHVSDRVLFLKDGVIHTEISFTDSMLSEEEKLSLIKDRYQSLYPADIYKKGGCACEDCVK